MRYSPATRWCVGYEISPCESYATSSVCHIKAPAALYIDIATMLSG